MNEEQKKAFNKFLDVAVEKKFNQMVCLAVASTMLSSQDWQKTISDIIALAEKCESCEEFGHLLLKYRKDSKK